MVSSTTTSLQISEIKNIIIIYIYSSFEKSIIYRKKEQYNILRTGLKVLMIIIIFLVLRRRRRRRKDANCITLLNWLSMFADIHNKLIQNEMMMFLS